MAYTKKENALYDLKQIQDINVKPIKQDLEDIFSLYETIFLAYKKSENIDPQTRFNFEQLLMKEEKEKYLGRHLIYSLKENTLKKTIKSLDFLIEGKSKDSWREIYKGFIIIDRLTSLTDLRNKSYNLHLNKRFKNFFVYFIEQGGYGKEIEFIIPRMKAVKERFEEELENFIPKKEYFEKKEALIN